MASSSSSSTSSGWLYDVFLSFRGEDTRTNFTDHLYAALKSAGIRTFRDDNELERGKEIGPDLLKAIEKSRFSIVVFSKNYASSAWCLDELAHIMNCSKTGGQTVLPVFYDVDPTDVRYQKRCYEEAFRLHEDRFKKQKDNQGQSRNLNWVTCLLQNIWTGVVGQQALPHNSSALEAKFQRWRAALKEAANLSGYHVEKRPQAVIIDKIVADISNRLQSRKLKVADNPVGTDSRSDAVKLLLHLHPVRIVGIYGIGGIGKTTIAKDVCNSIFWDFEGRCSFLLKVREKSSTLDGTINLQSQLLSDILKRKDETISSSDGGLEVIERRLRNMKILVVLDDVDDAEQIYKILGNPLDWLSQESRIIITTRNKDLVPSTAYRQYQVEELDKFESLWLFSINAFGKLLPKEKKLELSKSVVDYLRPSRVHWDQNRLDSLWLFIIKAFNDQGHPIEAFKEYSKHAVDYCGGIPLALEVLGSYLSVEKCVHVWKSKFEKLEKIPDKSIQRMLQISYDSLDEMEKKIFLDIACFFIGKDKNYTRCILDGCGFFAVDGINTLIKRCLLKNQFNNQLEMHDLIRDMGRHIVVKESSVCGERSRVWRHEEAFALLQHKTGTKAVEGLILNLPQPGRKFSTEAFKEMSRLRLLQLDYVDLTGSFEHMSKQLKWLRWSKFHLEFIPTDLYLGNLVTLDMPYSNLKQVWEEKKDLGWLRFVNLSHSHELTKISNFEGLPKLETLILEDCPNLVEVHESIKLLTKLVTLNLEGCENLENLPELDSLISLNLSGCSKLRNAQKLPQKLGNMINLDVGYCNLSDDTFPNLQNFLSLEILNLEGNNFSSLPPTITVLPKLTSLRLNNCTRLNSVPELPLSLTKLGVGGCIELTRLPKIPSVRERDLWGCKNLVEIEGEFKVEPVGVEIIKKLLEPHGFSVEESIANVRVPMMSMKTDTYRICPPQRLIEKGICSLYLPGSEIPSCFIHQSEGKGNSVTFNVPPLQGRKIQCFIICVVYASSEGFVDYNPEIQCITPVIDILNTTKNFKWSYERPAFFGLNEKAEEDIMWLSFLIEKAIKRHPRLYGVSRATRFKNEMEEGDEVVVRIWMIHGFNLVVKKWGVNILYQQNHQAFENFPQEQQHVNSDHGSSGYEENFLYDLEDEECCPFHRPFPCEGNCCWKLNTLW